MSTGLCELRHRYLYDQRIYCNDHRPTSDMHNYRVIPGGRRRKGLLFRTASSTFGIICLSAIAIVALSRSDSWYVTKKNIFLSQRAMSSSYQQWDQQQQLINLLRQELQQSEPESPMSEPALSQLGQTLWDKVQRLYYNNDSEKPSTATSAQDSTSGKENASSQGFPDGPVILGMERCAEFRRQWGSNGTIAVASLFNAGSNALTRNLQLNLEMPGNYRAFFSNGELNQYGVLSQVPWWKHNPVISDPINGRRSDSIEHASVLPIVLVRDFYFWRKSTCTARYSLDWPPSYRTYERNTCPSFFHSDEDQEASDNTIDMHEVTFRVEDGRIPKTTDLKFPSLVDLWNSFHQQYLDAPFPRLIVRYEDTLFHLPEILQAIQECAGASWRSVEEDMSEKDRHNIMMLSEPRQPRVAIYRKSSKSHGNTILGDESAFMAAIETNTNTSLRLFKMNQLERDYTREALDPTLVKLLHYTHPNSND